MAMIDKLATSWARSLSPSAGYAPPIGMTKAAIVWGCIAWIYGVFAVTSAFAHP